MKKRTILTRFWIGDFVYHVMDGSRGLITQVQICTDRFVPRYFVVYSEERAGQWDEEMELSDVQQFSTSTPEASKNA